MQSHDISWHKEAVRHAHSAAVLCDRVNADHGRFGASQISARSLHYVGKRVDGRPERRYDRDCYHGDILHLGFRDLRAHAPLLPGGLLSPTSGPDHGENAEPGKASYLIFVLERRP